MLRKTLAAISLGAAIYAGVHGIQAYFHSRVESDRLVVSENLEAQAERLEGLWQADDSRVGVYSPTLRERILIDTVLVELKVMDRHAHEKGYERVDLSSQITSLENSLNPGFSVQMFDDTTEDIAADIRADARQVLTSYERAAVEGFKNHAFHTLFGVGLALSSSLWCGYLCLPRKCKVLF